jgi:hypothetical protein
VEYGTQAYNSIYVLLLSNLSLYINSTNRGTRRGNMDDVDSL